jgi:hypothetical protein
VWHLTPASTEIEQLLFSSVCAKKKFSEKFQNKFASIPHDVKARLKLTLFCRFKTAKKFSFQNQFCYIALPVYECILLCTLQQRLISNINF